MSSIQYKFLSDLQDGKLKPIIADLKNYKDQIFECLLSPDGVSQEDGVFNIPVTITFVVSGMIIDTIVQTDNLSIMLSLMEEMWSGRNSFPRMTRMIIGESISEKHIMFGIG